MNATTKRNLIIASIITIIGIAYMFISGDAASLNGTSMSAAAVGKLQIQVELIIAFLIVGFFFIALALTQTLNYKLWGWS